MGNLPEELRKKLEKAMESGRYIVTVSHKEGSPPGDLKHYQITRNYPKDDIATTMTEVKDLVLNGNNIKSWK